MIPIKRMISTLICCTFAMGAKPDIVSWVPYYFHNESRKVLEDTTGDYFAANTLTHLGLQFWVPEITIEGTDTIISGNIVFDSISQEKYDAANDSTVDMRVDSADVAWFVNWGNQNNVKTQLCLGYGMLDYNDIENGWVLNWEMQKRAFHDKQEALINSLMTTLDKYDLDGVDIDLEGAPKYRTEFRGFIEALSDSVKARNKYLGIAATMNTQWLGVNPSWWEDYVGLVDKLGIMGYNYTYEGCEPMSGLPLPDNKYSTLYNHGRDVGFEPEEISLGLPGWVDHWGEGGRGTHLLDHLEEIRRDVDSSVSLCLWDVRLVGEGWRDPLTWQTLAMINTPPAVTITSPSFGDSLSANRVSMAWEIHSDSAVDAQEISIRFHESCEWIPLDTIDSQLREYSFDSELVSDSLFVVRVSLLDSEGKMIDYDKSDGYVTRITSSSIQTAFLQGRTGMNIALQGNQFRIVTPMQGTYSLSLFSLNGREVMRQAGVFAKTGVTTHAVPAMMSPGIYAVQIVHESGTVQQMVQILQ